MKDRVLYVLVTASDSSVVDRNYVALGKKLPIEFYGMYTLVSKISPFD